MAKNHFDNELTMLIQSIKDLPAAGFNDKLYLVLKAFASVKLFYIYLSF